MSRQPVVKSVSAWMGRRHSFPVEVLLLIFVYVAYDAGRGLVRGGAAVAVAHARSIASLERELGLLREVDVQRALAHVPGLSTLFGFGYDVFHLAVTGGVLLWLYFRHREAYPRVRTTLVAATGFALACFTVFPSAPPRLAGIGIVDTLSLAKDTAHSGALQLLYNPYAAMPSLHMAYAVIAGVSLFHWGRHGVTRFIGVAYPIFVAVEVVATGNHFFLDVAMGIAVDACALAIVAKVFTQASPLGQLRSLLASDADGRPLDSHLVHPARESQGSAAGSTQVLQPGLAPQHTLVSIGVPRGRAGDALCRQRL
jgi:PAP2 superfamily